MRLSKMELQSNSQHGIYGRGNEPNLCRASKRWQLLLMSEPANALNVRYTIPDGASGQLNVQVNGSSVGNLDLSVSLSMAVKVTTDDQVADQVHASRLMRHVFSSRTSIEIW